MRYSGVVVVSSPTVVVRNPPTVFRPCDHENSEALCRRNWPLEKYSLLTSFGEGTKHSLLVPMKSNGLNGELSCG